MAHRPGQAQRQGMTYLRVVRPEWPPSRVADLKDRAKLHDDLATTLQRASELRDLAAIKACKTEVETRAISNQISALRRRLVTDNLQKRIQAVHFLGAPYTTELTDAEAMAHKQAEVVAAEIIAQGGTVSFEGKLIKDSTAIALIAYLQRVGKDLFRVDPPEVTPVPETAVVSEPANGLSQDAEVIKLLGVSPDSPK